MISLRHIFTVKTCPVPKVSIKGLGWLTYCKDTDGVSPPLNPKVERPLSGAAYFR
jgi:hypothetical protein